ncbi:MAG TPA: hypothetical protein PK794_02785, partial [Armatimonadota bacterium]|nr:hypothetical protein [Armatimonadota bacterium]
AAVNAAAGEQVPLTATVTRRDDGSVVPDAAVTWGVTEGVGTISETGVFTAATQTPQSGTITAAAFDAATSIPVVVNAGNLVSLDVTAPAAVNLAQVPAGGTVPFSATGVDAFGNTVAVSPLWSVEGGVGQIDQQGLFLAQTPGTGTVVATVGEVRGTEDLTVVAGPPVGLTLVATGNADLQNLYLGQTVQFTAYEVDGAGNRGRATRSPVQAAWSVTGGIGCIDQDGHFIATGLGAGAVVAEKDGRQASLPVTVARAFVGAIAFTKKNLYGNLALLTGDGATTNLTVGNNHFGEAAWSPTAAKLAFVAAGVPQSGICLINADGTGFQQLYAVSGHDPAWSPDGTKLAFSSGIGITGQLVVITAQGGAPQTLAVGTLGIPGKPAWSHDGAKIAFCINSGFSPSDGVYLMNANGTGAVTRIYTGHPTDIAWKPGADALAVADGTTVYLVTEGSAPQPLAQDTHPIIGIAWAPNGTALACSVQQGAFAQLVLKLLGTNQSFPLTALTNASALDPTWQ